MENSGLTITSDHIRELWDAGLRGDGPERDAPALYLTADGSVVVSDRHFVGGRGRRGRPVTIIITAGELRNFTRGRFTAEDAREVAWSLTEELRMGTIAQV